MKKIICAFLLIGLIAGSASAEGLKPGDLLLVHDGLRLDVDGDGTAETISFSTDTRDEIENFSLTVDQASVTGEGISLTGALYVLQMKSFPNETIFLVPETGYSDDNACTAFLYQSGALYPLGVLPAPPESIVPEQGYFTCTVRGRVLQTWFRPADYAIATGWMRDKAALYEIPRPLYPMGTYVTLLRGLDVSAERGGEAVAFTLEPGDEVILAATDDSDFLYVTKSTGASGWVRIRDQEVLTREGYFLSGEVFDGLIFAD